MSRNLLWILILIVLELLTSTEARLYSNSITIPTFRREGAWAFIDRMHLDSGRMSLDCLVSFVSANYRQGSFYQLQLIAVPDHYWQKSLESKCDTSRLSAQELAQKQKSELVYRFRLTQQNSYKMNMVINLDVSREQTYHFVLRQCSKTILNDGYRREDKIELDVNIRNNDQNVSSGEKLYGWLLPLLIGSALCMLYFLYRQKEEEGDNWIKLGLKISLWVGIGSIVAKYLGYLVYSLGSGVEYNVFDVFYLLLHSSSDSILMILLMLLSYGWTVTFKNARDFDLYVPLAFMLGLVNIIMTMLNKISDGDHDKYHMYDTIPAYIMIGFRLVGLLIFLIGVGYSWMTLKKSPQKAKVRRYLVEMTVLGTLYLAFVPIGFVLIRYVGTRYKKEGMFFGIQLVRFGLTYWLALLAGWKKSTYRSIIDQSFMEKGDKFY